VQATSESNHAVLPPPVFNNHLGLLEGIKDLPIEHLISQISFEGFVIVILPGTSRLVRHVTHRLHRAANILLSRTFLGYTLPFSRRRQKCLDQKRCLSPFFYEVIGDFIAWVIYGAIGGAVMFWWLRHARPRF
jgi:hypothetical protein